MSFEKDQDPPFSLPTSDDVLRSKLTRRRIATARSTNTTSTPQIRRLTSEVISRATMHRDHKESSSSWDEEIILSPRTLLSKINEVNATQKINTELRDERTKAKSGEFSKTFSVRRYMEENRAIAQFQTLHRVKCAEVERMREVRIRERAEANECLRALEEEEDRHRETVHCVREEEEKALLKNELALSRREAATRDLRAIQADIKRHANELEEINQAALKKDRYREFFCKVKPKSKRKLHLQSQPSKAPLQRVVSQEELTQLEDLPSAQEILHGLSEVLSYCMQEIVDSQTTSEDKDNSEKEHEQAKSALENKTSAYQDLLESIEQEIQQVKARTATTRQLLRTLEDSVLIDSEGKAADISSSSGDERGLDHLQSLYPLLEHPKPSPGESDPLVILSHLEITMQHLTDQIETLPKPLLIKAIKDREREKWDQDKADRKLKIQEIRRRKYDERIRLALAKPNRHVPKQVTQRQPLGVPKVRNDKVIRPRSRRMATSAGVRQDSTTKDSQEQITEDEFHSFFFKPSF